MKTQTIAAIDIGSNSLKLAIVQAAASDSFTVVLQERERVRLGAETLRTHRLSAAAIAASADAVAKFRSIAENRKADSIIAVATASVREAENAAEFVEEIRRRTGVSVEVLSSLEEARLIGIAASQNFGANPGSLLNIDIGGGSTELSLMRDGEPDKLFSMRLGAVGLTERFIANDPPKRREIEALRTEVGLALEHPLRKIRGEKWSLSTGTSGTILNLAALIARQSGGGDEKAPIQIRKLAAINESLSRMTLEERAKVGVISPQRAEVIVAGGQILETVMRALGIESLSPCTFALREGVLIDHLREIEAESLPPVPDVEDKRLRGVFAIGRRYGYEERHALRVAETAEKIFDAIAPAFGLERHHRTLLSAAALLHDVGYHISHESHHKHSFYLIKHSEITGFSENEKLLIAHVARYHRGTPPKDSHTDYVKLAEHDKRTVVEMASILRIADAVDSGYEGRIKDIAVTVAKDSVSLRLISDAPELKLELEYLGKKKDMFEATFGVGLSVSGSGG